MERKEQLSSLDLNALIKEFQILVGSRIDKIYQIDKQKLLIRLRAKERKYNLFINTQGWVFFVEQSKRLALPKKEKLTDFAKGLRKYLSNGKITKIAQKDFDRIVELEIEEGARYKLVLELFSKGNIVLIHENKILLCQSKRVWRDRTIKPSLEYQYPPSKLSIFKISAQDFKSLLKSKRNIISRLVSELNLSKPYAQEICARAGISTKLTANSLSDGKIISQYKKIKELLKSGVKPRVVLKAGKLQDVTPLHLSIHKNYEFKEFASFNNAVEEFYWLLQEEFEKEKKEVVYKKELGRLQRILQSQEQKFIDYKNGIAELKALGDLITENHLELEELLKKIARKEDVSKLSIVSELNRKEGFVEVIIKNKKLKLDLRESVFENASRYYELSKKAKRKASAVEKAVLTTHAKIEELGKKAFAKPLKEEVVKKKKFWFEKYKWFITSDDFLVLAGRDAKSNERLVKRHLKDNYAYVHAEVHGAPSVIVRGSSGVALKEACEFALLHSKAWSSKLAGGDAYWVLASQVSKTAKAGEYVPKGAFVIIGKKNYFRNLCISAGVGIIKIDEIDKVICAPVETIKKKCNAYIILEPGELDKQEFAKKVAKAFNADVDEIVRILPPGNIRIKSQKSIAI